MSMEMPNFDKSVPEEQSGPVLDLEKQEKEINISKISPDNLENIKEYYQFEINNGFSELALNDSLEDMAKYRKGQMERDELKILKAQEKNELVATTIVVLKNGTMGKKLQEDEAHLAGIVVNPESEGKGVGEKMFRKADQVAQEAGKKSILTVIDENNYPSIRLTTKMGYSLVDVHKKRKDKPIEYKYRKAFYDSNERNKDYFIKAVEIGVLELLKEDFDENLPKQILIDPEDSQRMEKVLELGYQGVFVLKPEEHNKGDKSLMVFEKV